MEFPRNPGSSDIMRHRTPGRDRGRTKKRGEEARRKSERMVSARRVLLSG